MNKIKFIEPEKKLSQKIGSGGLSPELLAKAEQSIVKIIHDLDQDIQDYINALKVHVTNNRLAVNKDSNRLEELLYDLLPLKTQSQIIKHQCLATLTDQLLQFCEKIDTVNADSYRIIKSYIGAIEIVYLKNINDINHPFSKAVLKELEDARIRYAAKYM